MSKKSDRFVYQRNDGVWVNKKVGSDKASSTHETQQEAWNSAREMLQNSGGGELTVAGRKGKIVSKDTIAPGNDPTHIRDTEH